MDQKIGYGIKVTEGDKLRVNIDKMYELIEIFREINKRPFDDIIWEKNDTPIEIPSDVKEFWKFCGMCNKSFLTYFLDGIEIKFLEDGTAQLDAEVVREILNS